MVENDLIICLSYSDRFFKDIIIDQLRLNHVLKDLVRQNLVLWRRLNCEPDHETDVIRIHQLALEGNQVS